MGQYYKPLVERDGKFVVFDNHLEGEGNWCGVKLMEHSWYMNEWVGQVVNDLFYNKGKVYWVGDYYDEDDYAQVNTSDKELVKKVGQLAWGADDQPENVVGSMRTVRTLGDCILVNHTKKIFVMGNRYREANTKKAVWKNPNGKTIIYDECVHPLPLLTCSASHSGGSYNGVNRENCGTWFGDELEVVLCNEDEILREKGYIEAIYTFAE